METLTPAFSKTLPSCRTQEMPSPPAGRFHVSTRNLLPSSVSSAETISCWFSLTSASMRRRMGEEAVTPDSRLERESRSAIEGASVRSGSTGEVSWHRGKSVGGLKEAEVGRQTME